MIARSIALFTVINLMGSITALADNSIPPEVLSSIQQECNASFAQNTYRDMSAENCIGLAVEKYKELILANINEIAEIYEEDNVAALGINSPAWMVKAFEDTEG